MSLLRKLLVAHSFYAYVIVSYISVSCTLYIFLPLLIVIDGLTHKINKNIEDTMPCNHKYNKTCTNIDGSSVKL